jgi:uncharacterized coiled-coil DUF342 family protein
MNNDRRKQLSALHERVSAFQTRWAEWTEQLDGLKAEADELHGELESLRDEEQEYYDNMPESFQNGEKGTTAEEAVSAMDTALEALSAIGDIDFSDIDLDEALESIDNAQAG